MNRQDLRIQLEILEAFFYSLQSKTMSNYNKRKSMLRFRVLYTRPQSTPQQRKRKYKYSHFNRAKEVDNE